MLRSRKGSSNTNHDRTVTTCRVLSAPCGRKNLQFTHQAVGRAGCLGGCSRWLQSIIRDFRIHHNRKSFAYVKSTMSLSTSRFQQRPRLLTIRSNKRRREECYFQLRRKFRKKKIVCAFERPLFWFEHMVLNHYVNN